MSTAARILSMFLVALPVGAGCDSSTPEEPPAGGGELLPGKAATTGAKVPRAQAGEAGDWIHTVRYDLRVLGVQPCGPPEEPKAGDPFRLGVTIEVRATHEALVSDVVASPKAATIEKDGKVFAALVNPDASENCEAALVHTPLRPGQSAAGVVVFEAPTQDYFRSATFAFKPMRWGGSVRTEVPLPDCFGDCPSTAGAKKRQVASSGQNGGRSRTN
jgi:hypothetical protein